MQSQELKLSTNTMRLPKSHQSSQDQNEQFEETRRNSLVQMRKSIEEISEQCIEKMEVTA